MSRFGDAIEESYGGISQLTSPQRDHIVGIERDLSFQRGARLDDPLTLHLQHVAHVDVAQIGDDEFEQQIAAQVAGMCDRCRQPLA